LKELIDHLGEDRHELASLENRQILVVAEVQKSRAKFET
jgi:hypothetical protein